jgi:hypothetical protein
MAWISFCSASVTLYLGARFCEAARSIEVQTLVRTDASHDQNAT